MTDLRLTYDLAGYDNRAACAVTRRRVLPGYMRNAVLLYLVFVVVLYLALIALQASGLELPRSLGLFAIVAVFGGAGLMMWIAVRKQARLWRAVDQGKLRQGPTELLADRDGLTISTPLVRTVLDWRAVLDVIPGRDGLLILVGELEFFSVPASAFTDEAGRAAVMEQLRAYVAAARQEGAA